MSLTCKLPLLQYSYTRDTLPGSTTAPMKPFILVCEISRNCNYTIKVLSVYFTVFVLFVCLFVFCGEGTNCSLEIFVFHLDSDQVLPSQAYKFKITHKILVNQENKEKKVIFLSVHWKRKYQFVTDAINE